MALLTVRDLKRQFDTEPVFSNVTFDVQAVGAQRPAAGHGH